MLPAALHDQQPSASSSTAGERSCAVVGWAGAGWAILALWIDCVQALGPATALFAVWMDCVQVLGQQEALSLCASVWTVGLGSLRHAMAAAECKLREEMAAAQASVCVWGGVQQ